MIFKTIIELVKNRNKFVTREQAESTYYNGRKTKEEVYEEFKKNVNSLIKYKSKFETSTIVEINKEEVLERLEDFSKFFIELGYDIAIVDKKILGDIWDKTYMLVSWKRADP